jgi:hypothetical protein
MHVFARDRRHGGVPILEPTRSGLSSRDSAIGEKGSPRVVGLQKSFLPLRASKSRWRLQGEAEAGDHDDAVQHAGSLQSFNCSRSLQFVRCSASMMNSGLTLRISATVRIFSPGYCFS